MSTSITSALNWVFYLMSTLITSALSQSSIWVIVRTTPGSFGLVVRISNQDAGALLLHIIAEYRVIKKYAI